jgi:hypothetical protein
MNPSYGHAALAARGYPLYVAPDWASEYPDLAPSMPQKLLDRLADFVAAHPLKSVGVAVAAALVVGRLMR